MKDKDSSPSEQKAMISRYEEEKQALIQKLSKVLKENASLYERLAELDITMNIKMTELKKETEDLTASRDNLLEENESLLKELSLKEQNVQESQRACEIKQLLLEETNGHLATATQQLKDWESRCTDLGNRLETLHLEKAAIGEVKDTREVATPALYKEIEDLKSSLEEKSEENISLRENLANLRSLLSQEGDAFRERIRTEFESLLALKDTDIERLEESQKSALEQLSEEHERLLTERNVEIERLSGDLQGLMEQHESLAHENAGLEKGILDARIRAASLEKELAEREASVKELQDRLSGTPDLIPPEKEELLKKLEGARNEISSLNDSRESLRGALEKATKENEQLRMTTEDTLAEKNDELKRLNDSYRETIERIDAERTAAGAEIAEAKEKLSDAMRERRELEASLVKADEMVSHSADVLSEKERALSELEGKLRQADEKTSSLETILAERDSIVRETEARLTEALEKARSLEGALSLKENSLREMEEGLSEVSALEYRQKEELLRKLEEARDEISSLNDSRKSLLEALEKAAKANEILKTEIEGALALKDAEMNILMRDYDEKLSRLDSERAKAESELKKAVEGVTASEEKKAGETISRLTDALFEKDAALSDLEERHTLTQERIASLEKTIAEKQDANAELNVSLAALKSDMEAFTWEKEALSAQLREAESVRETQKELLAKVSALEENLERETQQKAELESALMSKDLKMEGFRASNESESKRLKAEIEQLNADAARAAESIKDLERITSLKDSRIGELEGQRSIFQEEVERQKARIESLLDMVSRMKEDLRHFSETSRSEKEALESSLSLVKRESETQVQMAEVLKADLSAARQHIAHLEGSVSAKESSLREIREKVKEYEKLIEEKDALSRKLTEAMRESHVLREVKTFLSEEAKKLDEELKKIKEENAALRLTLKKETEEAFAKILQSTGRLENTIYEGMHLAKKLEEISANTLKEHLPTVMGRVSSASRRGMGRSLKSAVSVLFLALVILATVAGLLFFKEDIYQALKPDRGGKKALTPAAAKIWAEGIKQTRSGEYLVTLVFLNKEAISVLGLSEKIPDTSLAENRYALLEIKAEGGCIPEGFLSPWTKNVAFLDASGTPLPVDLPESTSNERRVVYKAHACGEKSGAVYMRDVISIGKGFDVRGLTIQELKNDSPVILR